jgi:8-oxo-dGTP diphosphatase
MQSQAPAEQHVNRDRYQIIPRVLIFAMRGEEVLLLKLAPRHGKVTRWTGKYNGLGGHIERGEDPLSAAHRELKEESGLSADLFLCGTLIVDVGENPGIGLFIFTGEVTAGELIETHEGTPEWIPWARLGEYPLVDDAPILLERIRSMRRGDPPFSARSYAGDDGQLVVVFA